MTETGTDRQRVRGDDLHSEAEADLRPGGGEDLQSVRVVTRDGWEHGPPHELFARLRGECPVHWSDGFDEFPDEAGYWSVTTAEDIQTVSRDWRTYSSELAASPPRTWRSRSS